MNDTLNKYLSYEKQLKNAERALNEGRGWFDELNHDLAVAQNNLSIFMLDYKHDVIREVSLQAERMFKDWCYYLDHGMSMEDVEPAHCKMWHDKLIRQRDNIIERFAPELKCVKASSGVYTTDEEIEAFIETLKGELDYALNEEHQSIHDFGPANLIDLLGKCEDILYVRGVDTQAKTNKEQKLKELEEELKTCLSNIEDEEYQMLSPEWDGNDLPMSNLLNQRDVILKEIRTLEGK